MNQTVLKCGLKCGEARNWGVGWLALELDVFS